MIIFVSGPESTGKTALSKWLAQHYQKEVVEEFARAYLTQLNRAYEYSDVEFIAKQQLSQIKQKSHKDLVFFDTDLIIAKVWFDWVYKKIPVWLDDAIMNWGKGIYLLCSPDIPWEPDPLRENGEYRMELWSRYRHEIESYSFTWHEVSGLGDERFKLAKTIVDSYL